MNGTIKENIINIIKTDEELVWDDGLNILAIIKDYDQCISNLNPIDKNKLLEFSKSSPWLYEIIKNL